MTELARKRCTPCEGGVQAYTREQAQNRLAELAARWKLIEDGKKLAASFEFKDYYHTQAFVNACAWIAHREDHHPEIAFGYNRVTVTYWTHAIGGLSENDFICAAKIDALLV
ncbi:MAG: 4a-hydroxytetrahydrobiopterin dehydratase [Sinobacteraceae bacterium]|nr:4a-hydroxytetrahydrobiopterin dehydratase [Nevskia sp.]MDI3260449.1 4a-hydroxytetrahydrobiopterin dehydratase [Nevskiaceae bacterium]